MYASSTGESVASLLAANWSLAGAGLAMTFATVGGGRGIAFGSKTVNDSPATGVLENSITGLKSNAGSGLAVDGGVYPMTSRVWPYSGEFWSVKVRNWPT